MSWFRRIVLYTALSLSANAAGAQTAELMALREGTMESSSSPKRPKPCRTWRSNPPRAPT